MREKSEVVLTERSPLPTDFQLLTLKVYVRPLNRAIVGLIGPPLKRSAEGRRMSDIGQAAAHPEINSHASEPEAFVTTK